MTRNSIPESIPKRPKDICAARTWTCTQKAYNIIVHNNQEETTQMVSADEQINKIRYIPLRTITEAGKTLEEKSSSLGGECKDTKADCTTCNGYTDLKLSTLLK